MISDEFRYKILKVIGTKPNASQRDLARELGISLGKVNFCLKSLIEKGLVKVSNFRKSDNKKAYLYFLTPHGIEEKARVTLRFLKRKMSEYEALAEEIEALKREADDHS